MSRMSDSTRSRRPSSAKLWRLAMVTLFFVVTVAPAFLLTVYTQQSWFLAGLAIPFLWVISPRAFERWLPETLAPPMSGRRMPFAILFAIVVLLTINLSGVNYMDNLYALLVVVGITVVMLIFISLMTRMPRSSRDTFFDWLD